MPLPLSIAEADPLTFTKTVDELEDAGAPSWASVGGRFSSVPTKRAKCWRRALDVGDHGLGADVDERQVSLPSTGFRSCRKPPSASSRPARDPCAGARPQCRRDQAGARAAGRTSAPGSISVIAPFLRRLSFARRRRSANRGGEQRHPQRQAEVSRGISEARKSTGESSSAAGRSSPRARE